MMRRVFSYLMLLVLGVQLVACAIVPEAIEYRNMYTNYKMSDTIFLDVSKKQKYRRVMVDVRNTSQFREVDSQAIQRRIGELLRSKGYEVVNSVDDADYVLQVNVLYFDYYRKTGAKDGALTGAVVGGVTGAMAGGRDIDALIIGALAGGVGYVGGALIGSAIKIETFAGVVDIQVQERVDGVVRGKLITEAKQGASTILKTEREVESGFQVYRTKLAVTVTQTNLKRDEASREVIERLSEQIAGIF